MFDQMASGKASHSENLPSLLQRPTRQFADDKREWQRTCWSNNRLLNVRFPLADARSKPRCRLESCALARPTSRNRPQMFSVPPSIGPSGKMGNCSLAISASRNPKRTKEVFSSIPVGLTQRPVEENHQIVECCSHMHKDARIMHMVKSGRDNVLAQRPAACGWSVLKRGLAGK